MKRLLLVLPLLGGCLSLSKDYPERRFHDLHAERGDAAPAAGTFALKVRPFQISSRCEGSELSWRIGDNEWETDFYNLLFVPPRTAITEASRAWLGRSGLFQHVLDFTSHVDATHVLEGNVVQLHGDDRGDPKAVVEIQFFLIDDRATPSAVAFSRTYTETVTLKDASAEALVQGWNAALGTVLGKLETDLQAALSR